MSVVQRPLLDSGVVEAMIVVVTMEVSWYRLRRRRLFLRGPLS